MSNKLPTVSDHALCRYLDRVMGLDVESVRRQIAVICRGAASAHAVQFEGFVYQIRPSRDGAGPVITTVRPNKFKNPRRVPRDRDEHAEGAE